MNRLAAAAASVVLAVYALNFTGLRRPGTYRVRVGTSVSPPFLIASGARLYGWLVSSAVRYFTSERDGADVEHSVLGREPANLTDERAYVYAAPGYDSDDNLTGGLHRVGGPVNVSGGWFDADGGYEKFGYTASYADALMLIAARDDPGRYPALRPEAEFGLRWISRLWNPRSKARHGNIQLGAVTDGPSSPGNFVGLGWVTGMRACSYGAYGGFNSSAAAFADNVEAWPSVEPADDYTAISLLAFALAAGPQGASR